MRSLFNFSSRDLAIDLGTANTVVYVRGQGIVTSEPSVVAMEMINGVRKVRAVGDDAKLMMGKTPDNIRTIRPLRARRHRRHRGRRGDDQAFHPQGARWPEPLLARAGGRDLHSLGRDHRSSAARSAMR